MENNKLGSEPAFPEIVLDSYSGKPISQEHGVSKRFYAACAAMQGILSNTSRRWRFKEIVEKSYIIADEILKQENL